MKIISSYGIEIKHVNKIFRKTIAVYNNAVSFCILAFENEWGVLSKLDSLRRKSCADNLIHSTKNNKAKYQDFDRKFHKMPSYMRRNVISEALGHLSAYRSSIKNWDKNGRKGKRPALQIHL